jgi:putative endonuclease
MRTFYVYMMASRSRVLYVGVTNDLAQRVNQHKEGVVPGFTRQYRVTRLVHFEEFGEVRDAIAREKQLKGWRRSRKVQLIEERNPTWEDLTQILPLHLQFFLSAERAKLSS